MIPLTLLQSHARRAHKRVARLLPRTQRSCIGPFVLEEISTALNVYACEMGSSA